MGRNLENGSKSQSPGSRSSTGGMEDIPSLQPAPNLIRGDDGVLLHRKTRRDRLAHIVRILTAPAVVFGCSFALALQFALLTPFAISLGVSERAASVVWLMGPVTGLVVQPLVGLLSDAYHRKHATRLPIVYVAALLLVLSHFGIAFARLLSSSLLTPLAVVIISFWIFDACMNAIVVTVRAMLSDRFCHSDRTFAFSVLQFWTSMGYLLGYLTAASPKTSGNGNDSQLESSVRRSFLVSAVVVAAGTVLSILSVRDKRACRIRVHTVHTGEKLTVHTACLLSIIAGSCLTWFGWFSQQIFQSEFLANILRGDAIRDAVRLSAFGLVINSALSCITGLILIPLILSVTGSDSTTLFRMWSVSSVLQGMDLLVSPAVKTAPGAVLWEAAAGPMYAVALSVPYMLVANGCDHGSTGRVMALVNVAVCFPQLIVSLSGSLIVTLTGGSHVALFCLGGLLCVVAGFTLWVPIGDQVPPWSVKSAASSLIVSASDWFSPSAARREAEISVPFLPPLPSIEPLEVRLRGLSSPRITEVIPDIHGSVI
jgi:hypothetical protein